MAFYADKLCLTPKYLSALSKSVCGYTVQELVFRAIIRRSMLLLKNSNKPVQEIADEFHFQMRPLLGLFSRKKPGFLPCIIGARRSIQHFEKNSEFFYC